MYDTVKRVRPVVVVDFADATLPVGEVWGCCYERTDLQSARRAEGRSPSTYRGVAAPWGRLKLEACSALNFPTFWCIY
jgi:hypothetical protein